MTSDKEKPKRGRPRRYLGERPNWTIRLEAPFSDEIRALAEKSERSISEVCEQQIIASFRLETKLRQAEARCKELQEQSNDFRMRYMLAERDRIAAADEIAITTKRIEDLYSILHSTVELAVERAVAKATEGRHRNEGPYPRTFTRPLGDHSRSKGRRYRKAQAKMAQLHRDKATGSS